MVSLVLEERDQEPGLESRSRLPRDGGHSFETCVVERVWWRVSSPAMGRESALSMRIRLRPVSPAMGQRRSDDGGASLLRTSGGGEDHALWSAG